MVRRAFGFSEILQPPTVKRYPQKRKTGKASGKSPGSGGHLSFLKTLRVRRAVEFLEIGRGPEGTRIFQNPQGSGVDSVSAVSSSVAHPARRSPPALWLRPGSGGESSFLKCSRVRRALEFSGILQPEDQSRATRHGFRAGNLRHKSFLSPNFLRYSTGIHAKFWSYL